MNSWHEFSLEESELSDLGRQMLFPTHPYVGMVFLATVRKDGAPRLHPISLVFWDGHLYVFIPPASPKCADLKRDGRYALQAFPPAVNEIGKEFYLTGDVQCIQDSLLRQKIIAETGIHVESGEQLFELFINIAMYTMLIDLGTPEERPLHRIWPTPNRRSVTTHKYSIQHKKD
jgi:hypothetical protein